MTCPAVARVTVPGGPAVVRVATPGPPGPSGNDVTMTGPAVLGRGTGTGTPVPLPLGSGLSIQGGVLVAATIYIRRIDASGIGVIYTGKAAVGTAEASAGWTVVRTTYSALGVLATTGTGSGAWSNRASLTYS